MPESRDIVDDMSADRPGAAVVREDGVFTRERILPAVAVAAVAQVVLTAVLGAARVASGQPDFLGYLSQWDGAWFQDVVDHLYGEGSRPQSPAFYPLFPVLVRALVLVTGGLVPAGILGLVLNTVALAASLLWLPAIARRLGLDDLEQRWVVALYVSFPTFFFVALFYSEALFLALAFAAYLAALERRWLLAAVILAVLGTTRLTFVLVVGLVGLEFLRAHDWRPWRALRDARVLWFLLVPVGPVAYGLLLELRRGDPLAMVHAYEGGEWAYHVFDPNFLRTFFVALGKSVTCALSSTGCPDPHLNEIAAGTVGVYTAAIGYVLPGLALIALLAASVLAVIRRGAWLPLGVFGLVGFAFFTLNGTVVSVHRYVLPMLVVYLVPAALWASRRRGSTVLGALVVIDGLCQFALVIAVGLGRFAG